MITEIVYAQTHKPSIICIMILGLDEWHFHEISQFMRLWYLSHMRAAKAQTSLCICGKSSAPSGLNCEHRRNVDEGTFINLG